MPNGDFRISATSTQDVVTAVQTAARAGWQLCTARPPAEWSSAPAGQLRWLDLSALNAVIDYPARDMTITVQAGMTCGQLAELLAAEKQQLPVDCPDDSMSVAAMVASDVAGPRQYGYGTLRDYLIGMEAVDGQGRVFHAGGRVVKNVAGYDLCRLLTGSRGTLGILTAVTFKLKPVPPAARLIGLACDHFSACGEALQKINETATTPVVVDLVAMQSESAELPQPRLLVGFEGTEAACAWQVQQLQDELGGAVRLEFDSADPACGDSRQPQTQNLYSGTDYRGGWTAAEWRIRTRPAQVAQAAQRVSAAGHEISGHVGNGILYLTPEPTEADLSELLNQIRSDCGGSASTWESSYPGYSSDPLSVGLRQALDPQQCLIGSWNFAAAPVGS